MAGTVVADKWQNGDGTENYKCKAWVNFNGTGTVAIRASGNVSSITDNGTGDYTINFTTAMADGSYAISGSAATSTSLDANQYNRGVTLCSQTLAAGSFRIRASLLSSAGVEDTAIVTLSIFR